MARLRLALALLVLTSSACAEAPAPTFPQPPAASFAVSSPLHRAGAWQQFCEQAWSVPQASALASVRGADGWELVAMYNGVLCFKRPVVEAPRDVRPAAPSSAPAPAPIMHDPGF